jgi:hypothetical protein
MPNQAMTANTQIVQHNNADTRGKDVDAGARNATAEKLFICPYNLTRAAA